LRECRKDRLYVIPFKLRVCAAKDRANRFRLLDAANDLNELEGFRLAPTLSAAKECNGRFLNGFKELLLLGLKTYVNLTQLCSP
jgi:hypothetical protein